MIRANRLAPTLLTPVLALSMFVIASAAADAATVYKWTDDKGEVHYSDKKPAGNRWEILEEGKVSVIPSVVPNALPPAATPAPDTAKDDQVALERALADRRQRLLDKCEQDRGVDCATQVDTELEAERIQATGRVIHQAPPRATTSPR